MLADMSVPEHTHNDAHVINGATDYEDYCKLNINSDFYKVCGAPVSLATDDPLYTYMHSLAYEAYNANLFSGPVYTDALDNNLSDNSQWLNGSSKLETEFGLYFYDGALGNYWKLFNKHSDVNPIGNYFPGSSDNNIILCNENNAPAGTNYYIEADYTEALINSFFNLTKQVCFIRQLLVIVSTSP